MMYNDSKNSAGYLLFQTAYRKMVYTILKIMIKFMAIQMTLANCLEHWSY